MSDSGISPQDEAAPLLGSALAEMFEHYLCDDGLLMATFTLAKIDECGYALIERAELDVLRGELQRRDELLYDAWVLIANANEGNWDGEKPEWKAAAERWRDAWHETIPRGVIGEEPNERTPHPSSRD